MRSHAMLAAALCAGAWTTYALAATATVIPGDKIHGHLGPEDVDTLSFAVGSHRLLRVGAARERHGDRRFHADDHRGHDVRKLVGRGPRLPTRGPAAG